MKFKMLILFVLFSMNLYSQNIDSIDNNLTAKYEEFSNSAKYNDLKALMEKTLVDAKKIKYTKGIYWSYIRLGNVECTLGNYKESLQYLDKARATGINSSDYEALAILEIEYARVYSISKYSYELAISSFEKGIELSHKIKDEKIKNINLTFIYQNLYVVYWFLDKKEKSIESLHKAEKTMSDIYNLTYLAYYHINESKNNDSILHYLKKSELFLKKKPHFLLEKTVFHNQYGAYFENIKEIDSAIYNFQMAIKLAKEINNNHYEIIALEGLSRCYKELGNFKKVSEIQSLILSTNDEYLKKSAQSEKEALMYIHNENLQLLSKKNRTYLYIVSIIVIILLVFLFWYRKKNQAKITQNKKKIQEIERSNEELERKVNESYDELIQLAKAANKEFFTRFQEIYPDLIKSLLNINPDLKISELTLCAYIFLGFNNKDIAFYTFKSTYTIRNRKHNLRKKLFITDSDLDFELFLKKLIL